MRLGGWAWGVVLAVSVVSASAGGQQTIAGLAPAPATSVAGVLQSLAGRAGVVFVGQVQKIEPQDGVVVITFLVQQPVLGTVGSTYVMREWAGRWMGGQQRFVVGQRAMFFLHAPNVAGLSSPVEGMVGAVPVIPMGANAQQLVDVRWLATRVMRPVGSGMASAESGAIGLADAVAVVKAGSAALVPEPVRVPLPVGVAPRPVRYPVGGGPIVEPIAEPIEAPVLVPIVGPVREPVARSGGPVTMEAVDAQR